VGRTDCFLVPTSRPCSHFLAVFPFLGPVPASRPCSYISALFPFLVLWFSATARGLSRTMPSSLPIVENELGRGVQARYRSFNSSPNDGGLPRTEASSLRQEPGCDDTADAETNKRRPGC
jgi:hypothetical protein